MRSGSGAMWWCDWGEIGLIGLLLTWGQDLVQCEMKPPLQWLKAKIPLYYAFRQSFPPAGFHAMVLFLMWKLSWFWEKGQCWWSAAYWVHATVALPLKVSKKLAGVWQLFKIRIRKMLQRRDIQVTINANLLHDAMSIPESFQNGIFGKEEIW